MFSPLCPPAPHSWGDAMPVDNRGKPGPDRRLCMTAVSTVGKFETALNALNIQVQ